MSRSIFQPFLSTAAAALLFGLPVSPSPAASVPALLSVSAPTPEEARAVGAWYEAHIPARFRARQAVSVSLLLGPDMTVYLESGGADGGGTGGDADAGDGDIDGVFADAPPCITLRLPPDGVADPQVFAHEYGHYVWFDLLNDGDRRRYRAIYDRQKAAHCLITDYAADSVEEGFAEAFSYYVVHPAALARRDPLSYAFLARRGR